MNIKQMVLALAMSVVVSESRAMDIGWKDVVAIAGFTYAVKRLYDRGIEAGLKNGHQGPDDSIKSNSDVIIEGTQEDIATFRAARNITSQYGKVTVKITPKPAVVYPPQYEPYISDM